MTRLVTTPADDAAQLRADLVRALDGGPAIGLGMLGEQPGDVEDGTAAVIATSGSTGIPKRVVLSAEALRAGGEATARRIGSGTWLLALPAGYVAGMQVLVRSILAGTTPVVLDGTFSPRTFAEATLEMNATTPRFTSLVPAQIATLIEAAEIPDVRRALQAYEAILVGGQALPEPVRQRAADLGVRVVRTYGSTETSGGCVYDGVPLDIVDVRTVDGELRISGPMLADGYLGDPDLTDRTFVRDEQGIRWYRTGDLGTFDNGVVHVHGRADNVIVSGGINVSLDRVERAVRSIPGLTDAVVVGVEDDRWGEASVIVAPRGARHHSEPQLLDQARMAVADTLGKPARPARLLFVDEMPILSSGKPDRSSIRRML